MICSAAAADLCKEAAAAHERCYMSVINTGVHGQCAPGRQTLAVYVRCERLRRIWEKQELAGHIVHLLSMG
jgi:hypothetical protein